MQTQYEVIHNVVRNIPQPFKRADIIGALQAKGLTMFTSAAVAGWINRAKVKGDIKAMESAGNYRIAVSNRKQETINVKNIKVKTVPVPANSLMLVSPKSSAKISTRKTSKRKRDGYTQATMEQLRSIVADILTTQDSNGFEFVGGIGALS